MCIMYFAILSARMCVCERVLDALELELWAVVSCHVGVVGIGPGSSGKAVSTL